MKRRSFITLLGGAATAWPRAARAQQDGRVRRLGVYISLQADDPEAQVRAGALAQALQEKGWTIGRNLRIDYRWGAPNPARVRNYASELIALAPDVLVTNLGNMVTAFQEATHTVPIVFMGINDAVGSGRVESLARPGANTTGFTGSEFSISVKWLEVLKQIVPSIKRVAMVRDPTSPGGIGQFGAVQGAAPSFGVELSTVDVREPGSIERGITAFARRPDGGLIVASASFAMVHRELIISLANGHRLPAAYANRVFVSNGGLISYGVAGIDLYRQAAGYVDRILRGEKPADLPVQAPTKYETVLNMKTAKALGLQVPDIVLVRADEVIE